jgi:DNA polymerase
MTVDAQSLAAEYAAALDWWREAGVDCDYSDEPHAWLREPEVEAEAEPVPPPRTVPRQSATPALDRALASARDRSLGAPIGGDRARWPETLEAFREFWLTEPSLDDGALRDRVIPLGEAGAELMVLVGMPEEGDREALLSGAQGELLRRIFRAMGLAESETYLASALPRNTPLPQWDDLAARGLADLTRHHIELARPRRLITFGRESAMLARECGVPMLAAPRLETIARSPAQKRRFWHSWLEFSA